MFCIFTSKSIAHEPETTRHLAYHQPTNVSFKSPSLGFPSGRTSGVPTPVRQQKGLRSWPVRRLYDTLRWKAHP